MATTKKTLPQEEWPKFPADAPQDNLTLNQPTFDEEFEADKNTLLGTEPREEVPKMALEDLKKFVVDWLAGAVFTSAGMSDQTLIPTVFMPIALGAFESFTAEALQNIGIVWAYMSEAVGNQSINGYPFFGSVRLMHKEDWARASVAIQRELGRQKDIDV